MNTPAFPTASPALSRALTLPNPYEMFHGHTIRLLAEHAAAEQRVLEEAVPCLHDDLSVYRYVSSPFDDHATDVFGIRYSDALSLFDPDASGLGHGATPKQVARHIRAFVKAGGVPAGVSAR